MRLLTGHKDGGMDSRLKIEVLDEPGPGGACHQYRISEDTEGESIMPATIVKFQKGPVKENGLNGISQEVLLEIVRDRLVGFQSGDFACEANQIALDHVEAAMTSLQERTKDRVDRDVEGTNEQ